MLVDISKITLNNLSEYQIPRYIKGKPRGGARKGVKTFNEKEYRQSDKYKEYQHNYYLRVTKIKRKMTSMKYKVKEN